MPKGKRKYRTWDELSTLERDVVMLYAEHGWLNRFGLSMRLGCSIDTVEASLAALLKEGFLKLGDNGKYKLQISRMREVEQQLAANG